MKTFLPDRPDMIRFLMTALHSGPVNIIFTKKDGTEREIVGTLRDDLIPDEFTPKGNSSIVDEEEPEYTRVFDLQNKGWRTVRFDSIQQVS